MPVARLIRETKPEAEGSREHSIVSKLPSSISSSGTPSPLHITLVELFSVARFCCLNNFHL